MLTVTFSPTPTTTVFYPASWLMTCHLKHFMLTLGAYIDVPLPVSLLSFSMHKLCTPITITESQNHRMVGVGRDLCESSSPILLSKQGHLQQPAQDLVQAGLEYLQSRRLHNFPEQPVPVLRHPQREDILPHVQTELPVPQFVPISPCPVAGHY